MPFEEAREQFMHDTMNSWNEFRTTGLHATAEQVEKWLESWGTDNELPAPTLTTANPPRCD